MTARKFSDDEKKLISDMLAGIPEAKAIVDNIDDYRVDDMNDGGMGSLRVTGKSDDDRKFGKVLSEAELHDVDGVPVIISIIVDRDGDLFEIDVWKVDFSPLKRMPSFK